MRLILLTIFFIASSALLVQAEYREWTTKEGETIQGEYVRTEVSSIVLRRKDGQEIDVSLDSLSDPDLRYARKQVPPDIAIRVSMDTEEKTVGYTDDGYRMEYQIVKPSVSLQKESLDPYDASLTLEVVIIGQVLASDRLVILNHSSSSFSFTDENEGEYEYKGTPIDLKYTSGGLDTGMKYNGHLVAIRDYNGKVIAREASRLDFEENFEAILKAKPKTRLNENMRPVNPVQPRPNAFRRLMNRWF